MSDPTNEARAARASSTLEHYRQHHDGPDEDDRTCAVDLLADLMHLLGDEFEAVVRIAEVHHAEERAEAGELG